jgi:RNA polymerase sigma-70 factor (ECF subfamily)
MTTEPAQITRLILAWSSGDPTALGELTPLVHGELHRLARLHMAREAPGHTLQPTALVSEAFLRLVDWGHVQVHDRAHFFALVAQVMRRILVDHARRRHAHKRGDDSPLVPLDQAAEVPDQRHVDFVALDEALARLAQVDPRRSQIVELRFFGGLSVAETASALGVSPRTVVREWSLAQAWLYRALRGQQP